MTIREITTREMLKADLLASGWSEQSATKAVAPFTGERCDEDIVWEMVDERRAELFSLLNLKKIAAKLDRIADNAQVAGDYRAAAIATAKLADLLPLVAKP